ncbi:MAG: hypothetical protein PWQ09_1116 [Candidatus Cloacimonadota bacterium]|nr:hypothetical protein [Candidatus Cloacimonadota bacterium]
MRVSHSCRSLFLALMVLSFLLIPLLSFAAESEQEYVVQGLKVEDIPDDDGTGLVISWKPLPKEKKIIEYRVYRGVTTDSLFYIGKVDVNVETGVSGDVMYFYDKDYNYFVDLQASGSLKREKQQDENSPLFRRYPRDINIIGRELKNYDILGVIPEKDFYYRNKKVEVENENGDKEIYAGFKLHHFAQMAKKLKPDHKYYYTVLAVSQARHYYPHAKPQIGIPRTNSPEKIKQFYPVYVEDKQRLQFEWGLPLFADDHNDHNIYALKKEDLQQFRNYVDAIKKKEANDLERKIDPETEIYQVDVENPAELIFNRYCGYPYTPSQIATVQLENGKVVDEENGINYTFDLDNIEDYYFVFSIDDRDGYETFTEAHPAEIIQSETLPKIPEFSQNFLYKVIDRKDDKGDYNRVMWGKPVVALTNSTYLREDKTKIMVNYEMYTNEYYKIHDVYFKVYNEEGKLIDDINEYYQDRKLKITLEKPSNRLSFVMTFNTNPDIQGEYRLEQELVYDTQSKSLKPSKLFLVSNGYSEIVDNYKYSVYKRNYTDEEFRLSKRVAGMLRELDDNIPYENAIFKGISQCDMEKGLYYASPSFVIRMTNDKKDYIVGNLYREAAEQTIVDYQNEIEKYQALIDTALTEQARMQAEQAIEYYQKQIELNKENYILKTAAQINGKDSRTKFLDKSRRIANRSFEYKLVKSDGKGHFVESSIFLTEDGKKPEEITQKFAAGFPTLGKTHYYPKPNWFQSNKLPALIATLIFGTLVFVMINRAKKGYDLYIRPIAGIEEIDNAIGRATEMGRPILFVPGLSSIQDVATLAGLSILGRVAKKAAEYDTKLLCPVRDPIVLPIAQETVREAHYEAGRPDTFDKNNVFFITTAQFAFVAGVNGVMIREKTATNFYMGMFWAEALIMTETGATTGAIQIAGTDAVTQIPFFITTCDYTLIGEELYAASAYLAHEPLMMGTLKAQDYTKFLIIIFIIAGTILSTTHLTFLINAFPEK